MLLCKLVTTIGSENQTPVLHVEAGGDGEEVCGLVWSAGSAPRCPRARHSDVPHPGPPGGHSSQSQSDLAPGHSLVT